MMDGYLVMVSYLSRMRGYVKDLPVSLHSNNVSAYQAAVTLANDPLANDPFLAVLNESPMDNDYYPEVVRIIHFENGQAVKEWHIEPVAGDRPSIDRDAEREGLAGLFPRSRDEARNWEFLKRMATEFLKHGR
jgi:hypothetical protein